MPTNKGFSIFDEYDLKARVAPALICLLPPIGMVLIWWPSVWTFGGALTSGIFGMIILLILAFTVASLGEDLEEAWVDAIGTPHSARLISHRDKRIADGEKAHIWAFVTQYGHRVPPAEEEEADDASAQAARIGIISWLIEITRPYAGPLLLLDANIHYGFWRNLRALRIGAILLAVAVLAVDAWLLWRAGAADSRFASGIALAILCGALILFLLFMVSRERVVRVSKGYADRLFSLRHNQDVKARAAAPEAGTTL